MKLESKRELAARALKVGKNRVIFNISRLSEIKEAITKQDMKDLHAAGAIMFKAPKGKKKALKRKTRRRAGSIKKKQKRSKQTYVKLTRKLRAQIKNLRSRNKISKEFYLKLRTEIRNSAFKSLAHLKERIAEGE